MKLITEDELKKIQRDLDACQKVIWLAGGFDPAYCKDAQESLKIIDVILRGPDAQGAAVPDLELSQEQINFIKLVAQYPGSKLNGGEAVHSFDDGSEYGGRVCLWENPESLGLIECVGSYKWVPTQRVSLGLLIDGNLAMPSIPSTTKE